LARAALQLDQLVDDLLLARFGKVQARHKPIGLGVIAEMIEAGVTLARLPGRLGIHLFEIAQDGFH
jgi:hypothetical protein